MSVAEFVRQNPYCPIRWKYKADYHRWVVAMYEHKTGHKTRTSYVKKLNLEIHGTLPDQPHAKKENAPVSETIKEKVDARILIFDIETAPLKAYVWGKWGQNIKDSFLIRDWFMLTWAAKWLWEDRVLSERLSSEEVLIENDSRITKAIWKLLDEANIIIAHNGVKFDVKRLNTRFLKHGLGHPSPYVIIDTLKHARKEFAITSNRLDYIAKFLEIPGKQETEQGLWQRCSEGDDEALRMMEAYNIQDVRVLEDVYLLLRPYMRSHPNIGLYIQDNLEVCPACGSNDLIDSGEYVTMVNAYKAYRCRNCNSLSRQRSSRLTVDGKRHLTRSTPR